MARVKSLNISFTPSSSPDVQSGGGYKLAWAAAPAPVEYSTPDVVDLGNPAPDPADGKIRVDMSAFLPNDIDGLYNVGVWAYDDAGHDSNIVVVSNVPLDFTAPAAPTDLDVERS